MVSVFPPREGVFIELRATCLECQYLHRPNPSEDVYICLCTLETIQHELDFPVICYNYEEIETSWKLVYIAESLNFTWLATISD
jgi:hypothetical protein